MVLFLLKECDRMRYFLNVLWDYKIEDTYEKEMLSSLLKLVKCLNLKRQRYILSLWYVQKIVKYKKTGSFHSCTSTIVNLFFIQIKLCIDLKYRRGTTHVCSLLTGLKAIFYPPYLRFSFSIVPYVIEL